MEPREPQVTSTRRYHRGLAFDLWISRGAWFWRVWEPRSRRGVIGAAGSKAEARDSACATIDEIEAGPSTQPFIAQQDGAKGEIEKKTGPLGRVIV